MMNTTEWGGNFCFLIIYFVLLSFLLSFSTLCLLLVISLSRSVDSGNRLCSHVFLDMHYWLQKRKINSKEEVHFCIYCSALKLVAINLKQGRTQISIIPSTPLKKKFNNDKPQVKNTFTRFLSCGIQIHFLCPKWIFLKLYIQPVFSEPKNYYKINYP